MTQHDYIVFEPSVNKGVLKSISESTNTGIVKEFGTGYYSNTGILIPQIDVKNGDTIIFTQHLQLDIDNEKLYVCRGQDVIKVINGIKK